jgi:amino acid adenylation domain-containing protein
VKLEGFDQGQQQAQMEELYEDERHRGFDLQKGPLLRATLVRQRDDRQVLLLSLPGVCADAWTLKNLVQETGRAYAASLGGDESVTGGEVTQYVQFSEWQRELVADDDPAARRHWDEVNLESATTLTLPFEVRAAVPRAFDYETYAFSFNEEVATRVYGVAAAQGTTVGSIMLACWSVLLWRLTGQSELVVGAAVDGRKYEELHGACGLFSKVVPLKVHIKDAPFQEFLKQIEGVWREAYTFQEHFSWETAGGSETTGGAVAEPYVGVNFSYEERAERFRSGGVWFSLLRQEVCTERFKVRLTCARTGDRLGGEIHFDPRQLPAAEIERLAAQFQTLLQAALGNPAALVGDLELLSAAERRQLLLNFNNTRAEFRHDQCFHRLFEEQVERSPDATAVVFGDERLSYRELNAEANRLAHYLRKSGVGPEVRVGLCMERSADMVVGILGILKAGGTYVPLDAEHPQARLSHQLDEVEAPVLITQQRLLRSLPPFKGTVVCVDSDEVQFADEPDTNPVSNTVAQNLAYVIYTSGSTGVPKGVAVSHRNLVNYTDFVCRQLQLDDLGAGERLSFATVSTLSADLGNTCIFPALVSGGCLHVLGYDITTDAHQFANYVATNAIDVLKIVPSHLRQLLLTNDGGRLLPRKYLITGGEVLSLELAQRIDAMAAGCRLLNHYGPTETTIGSVVNVDVPKALAAGAGVADEHNSPPQRMTSVPIGRAIANTSIYVLDEKFRLLPRGVIAEIYIGGEGVARGYLRQPGLTAERFLPDPFSNASGLRMYRTGDLGRYLPDGNLEFLGRVDGQVKVRGFRVELGEIESVLSEHEAVRQAVVIVQEGDAGQPRLAAFVVTEEPIAAGDKQADIVSALRQHLRALVPDYMQPAVFVLLERLPLTPNGKVDRGALAFITTEPGQPSTDFAAPRNPVEAEMVTIWSEVLRCEQVSIHDNFFELGGDSILSIQIVARMTQAGLRLTPRDLFEQPTVAALAAVVGCAGTIGPEQEAVTGSVPLTPTQNATRAGAYTPSDFPDAKLSQQDLDIIAAKTGAVADGQTDTRIANLEDMYPLSPLQEGILFEALYAPAATGMYIRQQCSPLYGEVNIPALEQSWQTVIDRHPILRTSFSWNEVDKVLQLVHRRVALPLERLDWRGLSVEEQEQRLEGFFREDRARGFDFSVPSLMRLTLIQTGPDSFQFIWTYHHLLFDGWSRSLVHKEVLTLYDSLSRGENLQLEPPHPYRDYVRWLEQQDLSKAEHFWRETLKGFHVATSLGDERASGDSGGGEEGFGHHHLYLSEEATAALQNATRKQRLTLNTLIQGAWALLLSRYSGEEDIVFGITISGRPASLPHVEAIVGPFINTLPLRVQVGPGDSLEGWLKRLQSQVIELHQYDYSPLMLVQKWSGIPRGQQLFESIFVLANYPIHTPAPGETGNLDFGRMKVLAAQPYPLAVAAMPGQALSLSVGYDRKRFGSLVIARMLEDWKSLLEAIVERVSDPEQRLLNLPYGASQTPESSTPASPHIQSQDDMETQFVF